ncbi:MAG: hypothetical protein KDK71_02085 [Chlamydiia bacterium]|nr:hypothetical protein [Chlamydiia bacterium]
MKKSLYLQTGFGLALLGATFLASSRAAPLFPGLSKKGLLLTEGTLLSSSLAYNYFRCPDKTSHLEKMALSAALAFIATKWIPPKAAFAAGAATFVFSAAITKLTAPSSTKPTKKPVPKKMPKESQDPIINAQYESYAKNPKEWVALSKEERNLFAPRFFKNDNPPIPAMLPEEQMYLFLDESTIDDIYKNPNNYTNNQIEWLLWTNPLNINEENASFIIHVIEQNIPFFKIISRQSIPANSSLEGTIVSWLEANPIYYYAHQWTIVYNLTTKPKVTAPETLWETLDQKQIDQMPAARIHMMLAKHEPSVGLDCQTKLHFFKRCDQLNLPWKEQVRDEDFGDLLSNPGEVDPELLTFFIEEIWSEFPQSITSTEQLILIKQLHNEQKPVPPFTLNIRNDLNSIDNEKVDESNDPLESEKWLVDLFMKYPIYLYLKEDHPAQEPNLTSMRVMLTNLPDLNKIIEELTPECINQMSKGEISALYLILLQSQKLDSLPINTYLTLYRRYFSLFNLPFSTESHQLDKIIDAIHKSPDHYSEEDIAFCLEHYAQRTYDATQLLCTLDNLKLVDVAIDKKVPFPLIKINKTIQKDSEIGQLLPAIYKKKPNVPITTFDGHINVLAMDVSDEKTMPACSNTLTTDSIAAMSPGDLGLWHAALQLTDPNFSFDELETSYFQKLKLPVQEAFIVRFIQADLPWFNTPCIGLKDLTSVDLRDMAINNYSPDQLLWMRTALFKESQPTISDDSSKLATIIARLKLSNSPIPLYLTCTCNKASPRLTSAIQEAERVKNTQCSSTTPQQYNETLRKQTKMAKISHFMLKADYYFSADDELFFRNQFLSERLFPLTERYATYLTQNPADIQSIIQVPPQDFQNAEFDRLTKETQSALRIAFGEHGYLFPYQLTDELVNQAETDEAIQKGIINQFKIYENEFYLNHFGFNNLNTDNKDWVRKLLQKHNLQNKVPNQQHYY